MAHNFVIEKNVPIPTKLSPTKEVLQQMEIGDSIGRLTYAQSVHLRKVAEELKIFVTIKKLDTGFRLWRVSEFAPRTRNNSQKGN